MSSPIVKIIDDIISREGGFVNDPEDRGGRTNFGIAEKTNPEAWADNKVTEEEARAIYERKYVYGPGFDKIVYPRLREQLIDYGVNSGPQLAIMKLQQVLGIKADGVLGHKTLATIEGIDPRKLNNWLVIQRVKMIANVVKRNPSQLKYINGWINRALEWFIP